MLFRLAPNTPSFEVFRLLNEELLYFLEQAVTTNTFSRALFNQGAVGQACWDNKPSRDKFKGLWDSINAADLRTKQQLLNTMQSNQNLQVFFGTPQRDLLNFMNEHCREALKLLCTHLYCSTKDLAPIITAAGGVDIKAHFNAYRAHTVNGNICKACGMEKLAPFRANIPDKDQWRADYDHQLCKSKYPIFAVHPDNLIPLCDVCNQDAKKAKDLFRDENKKARLAFYPFNEEAKDYINIGFEQLHDPEPIIKVKWNAPNGTILDKLNTWDEVYEIRNRVEGQFRSLETIIEDELNPNSLADVRRKIAGKTRPLSPNTLKRKEWAYWYHKLFSELNLIDLAPFAAKWEFIQQQATDGGDYILNPP
ncbi:MULTISPECIES: hypothetical protein [Pseudoalteromonas]|uniref:hypothetical protein n=1 Tax=Pseudoalteromonas TaxID=53246 RepID=UPI0006D66508|nr:MULTISPECIES: hypothetical protein [Pseudoalteromonas]KPZ67206.1 hypothetical protein AN394_03826 [Pseudoalteromonas sp. P1-26]MDK9685753.1 hypothetical protein [Pseudoalteromonas shioyasakiensis]